MSRSSTLLPLSTISPTPAADPSWQSPPQFEMYVPTPIVRDLSVMSVIGLIDNTLHNYSVVGQLEWSRRREGTSTQAPWRAKLQSAARRIQRARGTGIDLPGKEQFVRAQELLERTGLPDGWSLGVMPDGGGGLEIRYYQEQERKHISVTLDDKEMSATTISGESVESAYFESTENLAQWIESRL